MKIEGGKSEKKISREGPIFEDPMAHPFTTLAAKISRCSVQHLTKDPQYIAGWPQLHIPLNFHDKSNF